MPDADGASHSASPFNRVLPAESEAQAEVVLRLSFARIQATWEKVDGTYMVVEDRSSLRLDDRYLGTWRGGALHRSPMLAAADSLRAARTILERVLDRQDALPMVALFPIVRTAMEGASLAIYLLGPLDRDERLRRSYYVAREDARLHDSFGRALGTGSGQVATRAEAEIFALIETRPTLGDAEAFHFNRIIYSDLVAGADAAITADPAATRNTALPLLGWWQWLSGVSHGKMWAFVTGYERRDAIVDEANDSAHVLQTAPLASVALSLQGAIETLELALRLYGQRSKAAWSQPEDATEPPTQTWTELMTGTRD